MCVCTLALVIRHENHYLFCVVLLRHLCRVRLYNIFTPYLIKGKDFRKKKSTEHEMCVFIFLPLLSETFLNLRRIQRDIFINVCRSARKVPHYSCQNLVELEISRQILEKYLNIEVRENTSSDSPVFLREQTDGWTDTHDKVNSRFSQFYKRA